MTEMEQPWYCRVGDEQRGPFTFQQLKRAAARGELKLTSLVRRADIPTWTEAGQIPDLWPRATAIPPESPSPPTPPPTTQPPTTQPVAAAPQLPFPPVAPRPVVARPTTPRPTTPLPATARPVPVTPPAPVAAGMAVATSGTTSAERNAPKILTAAERRQQARRKMIILGGSGLGGVVLVVIIGLLVNSLSNKPTQVATPTNATATLPLATDLPSASTAVVGNAEPVIATGVGTTPTSVPKAAAPSSAVPAVSTAAAPSAGPTTGGNEDAVARQIVQATRPWRDAQSVPGVSSPSTRLRITGVWLAPKSPSPALSTPGTASAVTPSVTPSVTPVTDETGPAGTAQVAITGENVTPAVAPASPPVTEPGASAAPPGPRVICVEVFVSSTEKSKTPLNYISWNISPDKASQPAVILVDPQDNPLPLVPLDDYRDAARQSQPLRLNPGQGVTDLLVFDAPSSDFADVRLALRATALGMGDRYLGFRFPREMIADQKPAELASAPAARPPSERAAGSEQDDAEMVGEKPSGTAAAPPAEREETIDDLRRQISESAKARKAERDAEYKKQDEEREKMKGSP